MRLLARRNWGVKIVAGILVVCVLGIAAYTSAHDHSFRQRQFDSNAWKQGDVRVRGEMVGYLLSQSLLRNKTRAEVIALLGEPDKDYTNQVRYQVDVGRRIAWHPFFESLIIDFDENARVCQVVKVD
jgi:co-chaperonin GroES (HSP10)